MPRLALIRWLLVFAAAFALLASGPGFRSKKLFEDHYAKHGREFGRITSAEYLTLAQDFRDARLSPDILESKRADGVVTRYHKKHGWFIAVNPDRTIRTFFKPNDGERYFHRQAKR